MTSPKNAYAYQPFTNKYDIRLLRLQPSDNSTSNIQGELFVENLSDNPSYEALSYVWGSDTLPGRLHLPTGDVMITETLTLALR